MKGWIKLHRKLQEHWIWNEKRKFSKFEAWIYILFQANHQDKKIMINGQLVNVKKGEFVTSEVRLAEKWDWDRKIVRKFLTTLENENMITKKSTSKYTSITVENWDLYQNEEQQKEQEMDKGVILENENITTKKSETKYTSVMVENEDLCQNREHQNTQEKGQQRDNKKDNKVDTNKNIKNVKNDKKNNNIAVSEDKSSIFAKANKHKYGEYKNVSLKDEELQKLKGEYQNWEELITYLDEYIEMKGYKAKSHYLCIKKWVVEAVKKKNNYTLKEETNKTEQKIQYEEIEYENEEEYKKKILEKG